MQKYSQTKAMLAIAKASLRSIMRSPSAVVFTLAFPLIFILVFGCSIFMTVHFCPMCDGVDANVRPMLQTPSGFTAKNATFTQFNK